MARTPDGLDLGIMPQARKAWEALCDAQDENPVYPCAGRPELYTDSQFLDTDEAEIMCHGCPLIKQCYDFAIANNEQYGVWGGIDFSVGVDELF